MSLITKQLSVFVENKPSRLALITKVLRSKRIKIRAFMIADAGDFGIIHLLVDDPIKGKKCLEDAGFTASQTNVIEIRGITQDSSIEMAATILGKIDVNISYAYGSVAEGGSIIMRTSNNRKAQKQLQKQL